MYPIEKYQFKVFEKTNEDGSKSSVVVALSTYAGKVVKGVAKCIASDAFSLEKGKQLAAARCDLKVCKKRCNRAEHKYTSACLAVENLGQYARRMGNYYSDAKNEYDESKARLAAIESDLG